MLKNRGSLLKTIEDYFKELVGPGYQVLSPVYGGNDWWVSFKHLYLYTITRRNLNRADNLVIYEDATIFKKETIASRKYRFRKIGNFEFGVPTSKSAQNWICFNDGEVERRSSIKDFEAQQKISGNYENKWDVAIECVRYVLGANKLVKSDNEDYKRLILKSTLLDESKDSLEFNYRGEIKR